MASFFLSAALLATATAATMPAHEDLPYAPTVITLSEAGQFVSADG